MHAAMSLRKVTNPISDFTFLSIAKSSKSAIKNPFLDSPKGKHPYMLSNHTELRKKHFLKQHTLIDGIYRFFKPIKTPQPNLNMVFLPANDKNKVPRRVLSILVLFCLFIFLFFHLLSWVGRG